MWLELSEDNKVENVVKGKLLLMILTVLEKFKQKLMLLSETLYN